MGNRLKYIWRILSSYIFFANSSNLVFWHTPIRANNLINLDLETVRAYPQNFEDKIGLIHTTDETGVIMLDYKSDLGFQYNPNAIAQLALGYYDRILAGCDKGEDFLLQADFFLRYGRKVSDDVLLWEYNFAFETRQYLEKPWRSALAQGQAISVLIRAYALSENKAYLAAAQEGFNAFRYQGLEHEGGVIFRNNDGVWLEEVIMEKPNHILNGFVWALWGVRDYALFTKDEYAMQLYEEAEETLRNTLDRYDLGFWTCYDDNKDIGGPIMPVSSYYQRLHITQMLGMYNLTKNEVYSIMHKKWLAYYQNKLYKIIAFCWKCYFKVRHW
ncbi:MAG: D-glucuronyl C5-epimerase family protein [Candidatus Orphnella occulta]|nr:D-glucuronyl C5-epimerase family protein [Candidatus Orphnella occulta]